MLYDPKWETKADPLTFDGLIAWLECQPARKHYNWTNVRECLACKYYQSIGYAEPSVELEGYLKIFPSWESYHRVAGELPWTYGTALKRAKDVRDTR